MSQFKNQIIEVNNKEESVAVQKYLFSLGYRWPGIHNRVSELPSNLKYLITRRSGIITYTRDISPLDSCADFPRYNAELTVNLVKRRDTVVVLGKLYYKDEVEKLLKPALV